MDSKYLTMAIVADGNDYARASLHHTALHCGVRWLVAMKIFSTESDLAMKLKLCISFFYLIFAMSYLHAEEIDLSKDRQLNFDTPKNVFLSSEIIFNEEPWPSLWLKKSDELGHEELAINLFLNKADKVRFVTEKERILVITTYCNLYVQGSVERGINIRKRDGKKDVYYCEFTDASFEKEDEGKSGSYKRIIAAFSTDGVYEYTALALLQEHESFEADIFLKIMESVTIREST